MLARRYWHPTLTDNLLLEAARSSLLDNESVGFCLICGAEHHGVGPDARHCPCESERCRARQVFGAEELLLAATP